MAFSAIGSSISLTQLYKYKEHRIACAFEVLPTHYGPQPTKNYHWLETRQWGNIERALWRLLDNLDQWQDAQKLHVKLEVDHINVVIRAIKEPHPADPEVDLYLSIQLEYIECEDTEIIPIDLSASAKASIEEKPSQDKPSKKIKYDSDESWVCSSGSRSNTSPDTDSGQNSERVTRTRSLSTRRYDQSSEEEEKFLSPVKKLKEMPGTLKPGTLKPGTLKPVKALQEQSRARFNSPPEIQNILLDSEDEDCVFPTTSGSQSSQISDVRKTLLQGNVSTRSRSVSASSAENDDSDESWVYTSDTQSNTSQDTVFGQQSKRVTRTRSMSARRYDQSSEEDEKIEEKPIALSANKKLKEKPETLKPGTMNSGTLKPETLKPETLKPGTLKPGTMKPGTLKPETLKPETLKPGTLKPETLKPVTLKPGTLKPGTLKPVKALQEQSRARFKSPPEIQTLFLESEEDEDYPTVSGRQSLNTINRVSSASGRQSLNTMNRVRTSVSGQPQKRSINKTSTVAARQSSMEGKNFKEKPMPLSANQKLEEKPTTSAKAVEEKPSTSTSTKVMEEKPSTSTKAVKEKPSTSTKAVKEKPSTSTKAVKEKPSTSAKSVKKKPSTSAKPKKTKLSAALKRELMDESRFEKLLPFEIVWLESIDESECFYPPGSRAAMGFPPHPLDEKLIPLSLVKKQGELKRDPFEPRLETGPPRQSLEHLKLDEVLPTFERYKNQIDKMFTEQRWMQELDTYMDLEHLKVTSLVTASVRNKMLKKLGNEYYLYSRHTAVIVNALLPLWTVLLFADTYKMSHGDALRQIKCQRRKIVELDADGDPTEDPVGIDDDDAGGIFF